jgi:hypothetical protein
VWFLADEVVAIQRASLVGRMGCRVVLRNGEVLTCHDEDEAVWKAVAGPPTDDAVSLGASLGKPAEQS